MEPTREELLGRGLPKWPQMVVTGKPVAYDRAKEIIRRTDTFFQGGFAGNDRDYSRRVKEAIGMPLDSLDLTREENAAEDALPADERMDKIRARWDRFDAWKKAWGVVETEYVHNGWLANAYIYGPHGWCHPDGTIGHVDNVGKWPSVEAVLTDWQTLAAAFFDVLDLGVTLYDREHCEAGGRPVVSIRVRNGVADVVDPAAEDVHAGHEPAFRRNDWAGHDQFDLDRAVAAVVWHSNDREHGLPWDWIEEWARRPKIEV